MSYPLGNGGQGAQPSYDMGYARNAAEAAHPELWQDLAGAFYPMLGATGMRLMDVSGHGHNGPLTGMSSSAWVSTAYGETLDFGGNNAGDYATLSTPILFAAGEPFTVAFMLDIDSLYSYGGISGDLYTAGNYSRIMYSNTGQCYFYDQANSGAIITGVFATGLHSYMFVFTGAGTVYIHRDGVYINGGSPGNGGYKFYTIGNYGGTQNDSPDGRLYYIAYWRRMLSSGTLLNKNQPIPKAMHERPSLLLDRPYDLALQIAAMRGEAPAPAAGFARPKVDGSLAHGRTGLVA